MIQGELKNIRSDAWIQWASDAYDDQKNCLFLKGDWTIFPIYARMSPEGEWLFPIPAIKGLPPDQIEELRKKLTLLFPETTKLLASIKSVRFAAFSRLKAHAELDPHQHAERPYRVLHMGIQIPPNGCCGLMVDGKTHVWKKEGEVVVFEDHYRHSAWNRSDQDRIVFYMEFEP